MSDSVFNWSSIYLFHSVFIFIYIHTYVFMCKCKSQGLMETKVTQELRYKAWIQLQFLQQATLGKSVKLRCFLISQKFYFI